MKLPKWLTDLLDALLGGPKSPVPTTPPVTTTRPPDGPPPVPSTTRNPTTTSAPWPPVTTTPQPLVVAGAQALLDAHNQYRARKGLAPLTLDSRLLAAAQKYADVMARTGHFDHTGPDGRSPFDRMKAEGYFYRTAGENIAYGQRNVQEVMQAWIKSSGHERNIRGNYVNVGFGIAQDSRGRNYWVANFGTPSGGSFIPLDAEEFLSGKLVAEWIEAEESDLLPPTDEVEIVVRRSEPQGLLPDGVGGPAVDKDGAPPRDGCCNKKHG